MNVTIEQMERSIKALNDRCQDYSDNCAKFEGSTDEDCFEPGTSTDLSYALIILEAIRDGNTIEVLNAPPGRLH
jgi:hypothetical protein